MKLDYSQFNSWTYQSIATPSTFIISSTHYLNNHLKLDFVINTESLRGFDIAASILAQRHLKKNEHHYAFIKDTITINESGFDCVDEVNA